MMFENLPLVLFDGNCMLCNKFIKLVHSEDKKKKIQFCALSSKEGGAILVKYNLKVENYTTIYFIDKNGVLYRKSSAILKLFDSLGFKWRLLGFSLWLIPRFIRNIGYDLVAKNRMRFFKSEISCKVPSLDMRERVYRNIN